MAESLSHIDSSGRARMVGVGSKEITERTARARGRVSMRPETLRLILDGKIPKGDVIAAARIAGIQAAKKTSDLIPLCHPLPIESVTLNVHHDPDESSIIIESAVTCTAKTGVEMEALTAVSVAALTLYDMCKSVDRDMEIRDICLAYKSGGRSGTYEKS